MKKPGRGIHKLYRYCTQDQTLINDKFWDNSCHPAIYSTIDVEPGAGGDAAHSVGGPARIEPAVAGEDGGDVEVAHHQALPRQVLTNQNPGHSFNWYSLPEPWAK